MKESIRARPVETRFELNEAYHYGKSDRSDKRKSEKETDGTCVE